MSYRDETISIVVHQYHTLKTSKSRDANLLFLFVMLNLCIPYRSEFLFFPKIMFVFIDVAFFIPLYTLLNSRLPSHGPCASAGGKVSFDYKVNAAASDRGVTC